MLADIYVAQANEAIKYDSDPALFPEKASFKNFTALELSVLWSIIRGDEWDIQLLDRFTCMLEQEGGERLIHEIPLEMMVDLSNIAPDQIASISSTWADTEELGWPSEAAREVIDELVRLSRQAKESSRGLYVWNCA